MQRLRKNYISRTIPRPINSPTAIYSPVPPVTAPLPINITPNSASPINYQRESSHELRELSRRAIYPEISDHLHQSGRFKTGLIIFCGVSDVTDHNGRSILGETGQGMRHPILSSSYNLSPFF